jgi:hypothetical protein
VNVVIHELLVRVFGKAFGEVELLLGVVLAFALWCLDYAIIERRRPRHAIVLLAASVTILVLLVLPQWDGRTLMRIGLAGLVYYGLVRLAGLATRKQTPK